MILIGSPDEIRALVTHPQEQKLIIVRPQESGPCVHCEDGTPYRCTYSYDDGRCPHLDDPAILCPVKDACYAMREIAGLRDTCEQEREDQDADMVAGAIYTASAPEFADPGLDDGTGLPTYVATRVRQAIRETPVAPPQTAGTGRRHTHAAAPEPVIHVGRRRDAWSPSEDHALSRSAGPAAALQAYRRAFPDSKRSNKAVTRRYHTIRAGESQTQVGRILWTEEEEALIREARDAQEAVELFRRVFPDSPRSEKGIHGKFYVIQRVKRRAKAVADEEPSSHGFYGDTKALHADLMDGAMCDRPLSAEPDTFRPGDRVALLSDPDRVGEVTCVSPSGVSVSVQFPGDGPARVFAREDLSRREST